MPGSLGRQETTMITVVKMIRREQSKHPLKPKGCNGWWSAADGALLHGRRCPACEPWPTGTGEVPA